MWHKPQRVRLLNNRRKEVLMPPAIVAQAWKPGKWLMRSYSKNIKHTWCVTVCRDGTVCHMVAAS